MKRTYLVAAAAALAIGFVGLSYILASNVGFRISYSLLSPPASAGGANWLSLPYRNRTGLQTAADLFADLGGAGIVASVARRDPLLDKLLVYTGGPDNNFNLLAGEGVIVTMNATVTYEIVGSHDPRQVVTLLGPEDSASGTNQYAPPYNAKSLTAEELLEEIGRDSVVNIQRLLRSSGVLETYSGVVGSAPNFTLVRGESYQIKMARTVRFVPATLY